MKHGNSIRKLSIFAVATAAILGAAALPCAAQIQPLTISSVVAGTIGNATGTCTTGLPAYSAAGYGTTMLGDGCPATQAGFSTPYAATVDSLGNIYIGDYAHYEVRVVYKGGAALAAALVAANPGLTFTPMPGYIYTLAGGRNASLPSLAPAGSTTKSPYCTGTSASTVGSGQISLSANGDNCPAAYAYVKPRTIALDRDGNVYMTSGSTTGAVRVVYIGGTTLSNLIQKLDGVTPTPGYMYSIIYSKTSGYAGDGGLANATTVQIETARDVAIDSKGNIYMSDGNSDGTTSTNNNVRRVDAITGIITTVAGSPGCVPPNSLTAGCPSSTSNPLNDGGPATSAYFNSPYSIAFDSNDNLYIADYTDARVRVVYNAGTLPGIPSPQVGYVYTVAGGGATTGTLAVSGTLQATALKFTIVGSIGVDSGNNLYLWDSSSATASKLLWKVNAQSGVATVVGGGIASRTAGGFCSGSTGLKAVDTAGDGCASVQAPVQATGHFTFDNYGNLYETESTNAIVREFSFNTQFPNTNVGSNTTQAQAYLITAAATKITAESFGLQSGTTAEFSDAGNDTCALNTSLALNTVCVVNVKFAPALAGRRNGNLTLQAATPASVFLSGDGVAPNISVDPAAVATLGTGLKPAGVAVDLAGNSYLSDATANQVVKFAASSTTATPFVTTGLSKPAQIAVDGMGNVYIADAENNRVLKTTSAGVTVSSLGTGLSNPQGVAVDSAGNVYIADTGNNRIVELPATGGQIALTGLVGFSGLSTPLGLWIDAANALYVADSGNNRVVELAPNATQVTLNLGTTTVTPTAVAVDAAGDVYITDTASLQVLEYPVGSTNAASPVTGLKAPNGLAIDTNGSLYIADSLFTGELVANRAAAATTFPLTNLNTTNTAQVNVSNTGNADLLFNGSSLTTATGNTAVFSIASASTGGCALNTAVTAGTYCALTASFSPATAGSYSETASFVTNAANNGSATDTLSGTAALLVNTTVALAVTSPTTTPIYYGQPVTVTVTVTPATRTVTPGGTVTFSVDGHAQAPQTLPASGTLPLTLNPAVGTHAISVSYSGDTIYASGSNSLSFTTVKAVTTTTLGVVLGSSNGSPTLTFNANVSSPTATGETHTVSFYAGSTLIGTVNLINNAATYTTSTITYNSYSFTAVYSGDTNFAGSTSAALVEGGDYIVTPQSTSIGTAQGGVASASVSIAPLFNYTGTITMSCGNLPANTVCRFAPQTVQMDGSTTQTVSILVYTNVPSTIASFLPFAGTGHGPWQMLLSSLGLLWLACIGGLAVWQRQGAGVAALRARRLLSVLLLVGMLGAGLGLAGCGSGAANAGPVTPAGTQTITVNFAGSNGSNHAQGLSFTVTSN